MSTFSEALQAMQAVDKMKTDLRAALSSLPDGIRSLAIDEIMAIVAEIRPLSTIAPLKSSVSNTDMYPTVSEAVIAVLSKATHPMSTREVYGLIEGKFTTSADNPRRVVVSTLSNLAARGRLTKTDDDRYSLASDEPKKKIEYGGWKPTLRKRVEEFFEARQNEPATVADISKATHAESAAIRSLFALNRNAYILVGKSLEGLKLWRMTDVKEQKATPEMELPFMSQM